MSSGFSGRGGPAAAGEGEVLDLRGLKCPLPALLTRRALGRLAPGRHLAVLCTDPLAGVDIPHLLRGTGDALLASTREGDATRFLIRRARPGAPERAEGAEDQDPGHRPPDGADAP